jgi:hypothetical protein
MSPVALGYASGMEQDRDLQDLEQRADHLEEHIQDVRRDWERKRNDPAVPGAPAPDPGDADGGAIAGDWEGQGPAADKAGQ